MRPNSLIFLWLFLLLFMPQALGSVSIETLVDPRPNSRILDSIGLLHPDTKSALDRLITQTREQTQGEIMVVVVDRSPSSDHRAFATKLFNHWSVGDKNRNDGVLIYVALTDRAAEIILGSGIDREAQLKITDEIMQQVMIPRFKAGEPADAVFQGALAVSTRLFGAKPSVSQAPSETAVPDPNTTPSVISIPPQPASTQIPLTPETTGSNWAWIGGGGGAGIAGLIGLRIFLRRRARHCPGCKQKMIRLNESADDNHLSQGEKTEERVKSVDYDIWYCEPCNQMIKLRYRNWFSFRSRCPNCQFRTVKSTSSVISPASYTSSGTMQVTESCDNCSYHRTYTRTIPRRTPPSTSSSGSSSSSHSSSGSSYHSGGSSSGSGSSGRW